METKNLVSALITAYMFSTNAAKAKPAKKELNANDSPKATLAKASNK